MRIAIPSMHPGGLQAERSAHFGHCELFTVVEGYLKGEYRAAQGPNVSPHW